MKIFLVTLAALFVVSVIVMELLLYAYRNLRGQDTATVRKRLQRTARDENEDGARDILRKKDVRSSLPTLNELLSHLPGIRSLERLTQQARVGHPLSVYLILSLILAILGYWITSLRTGNIVLSLAVGLFLGSLPFYYLHSRKKKRADKFQRQLPEALEMTARGLRAGHAFTTGLKLVADGFEDPLGTEFRHTVDEINFGGSVSDALKNLSERVDCEELKFFVVSAIIQRETGGNLADIMDSIARILRHRFSFLEKVRVISSEARLSAKIIIALPFCIMVAVRLLNPEYLDLLFSDAMGRAMLGGAVVLMLIGIVVIMRMVKIEV